MLTLHGEIDLFTAPGVSVRLDAATVRPGTELVVDLRAVTFMDCSGLSVLCRARERLLRGGGSVRLVVNDSALLRLLRLTELSEVFDTLTELPETFPVVAVGRVQPYPRRSSPGEESAGGGEALLVGGRGNISRGQSRVPRR
ncbi:STAS domain-containing protein [Streptomyces sp. DvalAA-14]|uniref:STAS domain-containing protein n=1 Tax=Streptomyces sp. DvalAA-14 TaxID=1839759 RepID=UPI00351F31A8